MTRHLLAYAAVTVLGATAAPAVAQDAAAPPARVADPQSAPYPAPPPAGGPEGYGAPFAHPAAPGAYPGVYPGSPAPYPPPSGPYTDGTVPYPHGPMAWHGDWGPAYGAGAGSWYYVQAGGAPCGCPGYTWVPVPIQTHYSYSPARRHVEEVVEEKVVRQPVVEEKIVPVRRETKYVKAAPPKLTKGKVVKSGK